MSDPFNIKSDYEPVETVGQVSASPTVSYFPSQVAAEGIESIRQARRSGSHYKRFPLKRTGGVAVVRRPSLLSLAVNGKIPQHLKQVVDSLVLKGTRDGAQAAEKEFMEGDIIGKMADLFRATAIAGFVNPKLVGEDHAGPLPGDTMYVSDIDIDDLGEYFYWCQTDEEEKARGAAAFPREQNDAVPAGPRLSPVRADSV